MKRCLLQEWLRAIACASMLLDHLGAARSSLIALRAAGRLAFPLFCFLLAEGAAHTQSPRRYALRLGIGALLSELPFDLFLYGGLSWNRQNVMFTLLLAFFALQARGSGAKLLFMILVAAAADLLRTDYGGTGVVLVGLMAWVLPRSLPGCLAGMTLLFASLGGIQLLAVFAMLPIRLYSGQRRLGRRGRWLFYAFYPAHLLLLYLWQ